MGPQHRQAHTPLCLQLPLRRESAGRLRAALRRYLAAHAIPSSTARDVVLAAEEACINAIMHSGAIDTGFELTAEVVDHSVVLEVSDQGCGLAHGSCAFLPPADPLADRGRGLFLIHEVMDEVEVVSDSAVGGARLRMVKRFRSLT